MSEEQRIGQALLDLAARLPEGHHTLGSPELHQATMYVGYDAGDEVWEIEYCALDQLRNRYVRGPDLAELLTDVLVADRGANPNV